MIYNQDEDDFNFLSDKRVGEKNITQEEPRRRGGSYQEKSHRDYNEEKVTYNEKGDEEKVDIFSISCSSSGICNDKRVKRRQGR